MHVQTIQRNGVCALLSIGTHLNPLFAGGSGGNAGFLEKLRVKVLQKLVAYARGGAKNHGTLPRRPPSLKAFPQSHRSRFPPPQPPSYSAQAPGIHRHIGSLPLPAAGSPASTQGRTRRIELQTGSTSRPPLHSEEVGVLSASRRN
jgi:hypothetical protein